ncbi:MAG: hypothetical protein RIC55_29930 [Pirellulaceae bacterium]
MPIDFRCTHCGKLLRVGDDAAGKKSRCPDCGNIQDIPAGSTPESPAAPQRPIPPSQSGFTSEGFGSPSPPPSSPFNPPRPYGAGDGGSTYGGNPYAESAASGNPYAAPAGGHDYRAAPSGGPLPEHIALGRLQGPAIVIIVFSILGLACMALMGLGFAIEVAEGRADDDSIPIVVLLVLNIPLRLVMLIGAIAMLRLKNYPLSMAAAVVTVLPCGFCLCLDVPFGIWAIVVLSDAGVRAAFK